MTGPLCLNCNRPLTPKEYTKINTNTAGLPSDWFEGSQGWECLPCHYRCVPIHIEPFSHWLYLANGSKYVFNVATKSWRKWFEPTPRKGKFIGMRVPQ